jgi:hypothetical protein
MGGQRVCVCVNSVEAPHQLIRQGPSLTPAWRLVWSASFCSRAGGEPWRRENDEAVDRRTALQA